MVHAESFDNDVAPRQIENVEGDELVVPESFASEKEQMKQAEEGENDPGDALVGAVRIAEERRGRRLRGGSGAKGRVVGIRVVVGRGHGVRRSFR
jgi:hypothetical protein